MLHGVFAASNDKHCPHLSFVPMPDYKGNLKCQSSKQMDVVGDGIFTQSQVDLVGTYLEKMGIAVEAGYRVNNTFTARNIARAGLPAARSPDDPATAPPPVPVAQHPCQK